MHGIATAKTIATIAYTCNVTISNHTMYYGTSKLEHHGNGVTSVTMVDQDSMRCCQDIVLLHAFCGFDIGADDQSMHRSTRHTHVSMMVLCFPTPVYACIPFPVVK